MQRVRSADELGEFWSLLPDDLALLAGGRADAGKLGFVIQLAFWRPHGGFLVQRPCSALCPRSRAASQPVGVRF